MRAEGRLDVLGGHWLARFVSRACGLPRFGRNVPVTLDVVPTSRGLMKIRRFDDEVLVSTLRRAGDDILECCGRARMRFRLVGEGDTVEWKLRGFSLGPVPLPRFLAPRIRVWTQADGDGWRVEISIAAPMLGLLCAWKGRMVPQ